MIMALRPCLRFLKVGDFQSVPVVFIGVDVLGNVVSFVSKSTWLSSSDSTENGLDELIDWVRNNVESKLGNPYSQQIQEKLVLFIKVL